MPGVDGIAVLAQMRSINPSLPAINLSAYSPKPSMQITDDNITRFVPKPIEVHTLSNHIHDLLDESRRSSEAGV